MSVLRPMDKLPDLNRATILLVGTEDALLQQLAESMLKDDCASELRVHLANSLPLPSDVNRPRIDLIVFVVNLHSKHSFQKVEESLNHVDSHFFLGKVCFLATGAGRESHCSVHRSTVVKLAHTYRSPLLFCDLEVESFRATMAQRLVRMLQICAGHVPGVSALNLLSLLRSSDSPPSKESYVCACRCPARAVFAGMEVGILQMVSSVILRATSESVSLTEPEVNFKDEHTPRSLVPSLRFFSKPFSFFTY